MGLNLSSESRHFTSNFLEHVPLQYPWKYLVFFIPDSGKHEAFEGQGICSHIPVSPLISMRHPHFTWRTTSEQLLEMLFLNHEVSIAIICQIPLFSSFPLSDKQAINTMK